MSYSGNILFISYDGMTDPLGQSQVLPYLAGLSAKGHNISLLSCEKPERASVKPLIENICRRHNIDWHPISYTRKPPILSTVKDVRKIKQKTLELHRSKKFDIIHCRSYISALAGQWMKKEHGVPFIFDMRGFWADERVDGGLWKLSNPLFSTVYKFFKKKEKQYLEQADAIVSLTHAAKEEIAKWPLAKHTPIDVIPCCVDTELFDPAKINTDKQLELRRKAGIPDGQTVLGYVGSLGTWYLLPEMLAFFKVWLQQKPESILFFVTTEPEEMIHAEAQQQGIPADRIYIVSAARNEVPYYISMMHYGLFFLKKVFSKMASSPVKQGELMAMGIPVICNAGVGDSDRIVQQYKAGVLVHDYSPEGYSKALQELANTSFDPAAIREGCFDYFDLAKGIESYAAIYRSLCAPKTIVNA
ncbi:glycosyltransferase family 4 protein [Chitinophagaceae bacterium MMS25-I14]